MSFIRTIKRLQKRTLWKLNDWIIRSQLYISCSKPLKGAKWLEMKFLLQLLDNAQEKYAYAYSFDVHQ